MEAQSQTQATPADAIQVLRSPPAARAMRESLSPTVTVGLVATMGGLHAGHEALIKASVEACDVTIVTLFVNPAQFAPHEDLSTYPRTEAADLALCSALGANAVFAPASSDVYPAGYGTYIITNNGSSEHNARSEGAARPTFFRGVATVVTKLLILFRPTHTFFGRKDAQQCAVVSQLIRDLWIDVAFVTVPTARERDGLALSSRNVYLTVEGRAKAPRLYGALCAANAAYQKGERGSAVLRGTVAREMKAAGMECEYVSVCRREDMKEFRDDEAVSGDGTALVCAAVVVGAARLIDNIALGCSD